MVIFQPFGAAPRDYHIGVNLNYKCDKFNYLNVMFHSRGSIFLALCESNSLFLVMKKLEKTRREKV